MSLFSQEALNLVYGEPQGAVPSNVQSFVDRVAPLAQMVGERLNVDPAILIGQWGLETGWGKSVVPGTNNLGNIKDFSGRGPMATDNMTGSRDAYRAYDSLDAFGDDYASLIERRYRGAMGAGSDAEAFARALKSGGYAEDPDYVAKMVRAARMAGGVPVSQRRETPYQNPLDALPQGGNSPMQRALEQDARQQAADDAPISTSFSRGWEGLKHNAGLFVDTLADDAESAAQRIAAKREYDAANPAPTSSQEFLRQWDELADDDYLGMLATFARNPGGTVNQMVEQTPNSLPGLALQIPTAIASGALFATGWGAPLAIALQGAAAFAGNVPPEVGAFVEEQLSKSGVDTNNPAAVAQWLSENRDANLAGGATKAGVISLADGVAGYLGGKLIAGPSARFGMADRTILRNAGVDVADRAAANAFRATEPYRRAIAPAAQELLDATTGAQKLLRATGAMGLESFGEGAGEYGGSLAATGEASAKDAVLEAAMGFGQSTAMTGANALIGKMQRPAFDRAAMEKLAASGTPPAAPKPNSPLQNAANAAAASAPPGAPAGQGAAPADPAARLAELEAITAGTPAQTVMGPNGRPMTIPGEQPRLFTQQERDEYRALKAQMGDTSPAADQQGADPDPLAQRVAQVASIVEDKALISALRSDPRFGKESVTDLLAAYAKARNPTLDPLLRERALSQIEQFTGALVGPNALNPKGETVNLGGEQGTAPGQSVVPASPAAGQVAPFTPAAPADDGMTLDGEFRAPSERMAGANPNQLAAPPVLGLPTEEALQARRDAEAAYDQAFQDLVKAEQLGASEAELGAYQRALFEADAQRKRLDAELAAADARVADARKRESQAARRAILAGLIEQGVPAVNPVSGLAASFTAALQQQGYGNIVPTADEMRAIQRAVDVANAQGANVEPAAPNEMPAELVPARAPTVTPTAPRGDKTDEVVRLLSQGWKLNGKTLVSPRGKRRILNLKEQEAVRNAQKALRAGLDPTAAAQGVVPAAPAATATQEGGVTDDVPTTEQVAPQAQEARGQESAQEARDDLIARYAQAESFSDEEAALSDRLKDATRTEVSAKISAGEMPVFETGRDTFATVTPSAQQPGMLQVTRYNRSGVMGDSQYRSVDDALAGEFFHQKRMIPQAEAEQRFAEALQAEAEYQARARSETAARQQRTLDADGRATRDRPMNDGATAVDPWRESSINRGYDTEIEVDARALKAAFERSGEALEWNKAKSDAIRSGAKSNGIPEVAINEGGPNRGGIGINDGRHRIAVAAERGEKIKIMAPAGDLDAIQRAISQQPTQAPTAPEQSRLAPGQRSEPAQPDTDAAADAPVGEGDTFQWNARTYQLTKMPEGEGRGGAIEVTVWRDGTITLVNDTEYGFTREQFENATGRKLKDAAPAASATDLQKSTEDARGEGTGIGAPAQPAIATALDAAAHEAATSPLNDLPQPTDAQKEAGNYAKGSVRLHGMDISIENPQGSVRSGTAPDGTRWENRIAHHYGYIKGSRGADNDQIDVFLTDGAEEATVAWVIDQKNDDGSFDEHKAVIGPKTEDEARAAYLANYDEGWDGLGAITSMPMEAFKAWALDGKRKRKALAYVAPDLAADTKPAEAAQRQEQVADTQKPLAQILAEQNAEIDAANARHAEVMAKLGREMGALESKINPVRNKGQKRDELNDRARESRLANEAEVRAILDRYRPIIDAHPEEIERRAESRRKTQELKAQMAADRAPQPLTSTPFATFEQLKTALKVLGDVPAIQERLRDRNVANIPGKGWVNVPNKLRWDEVRANIPVRIETYRLDGVPARLADVTLEVMESGAVTLKSRAEVSGYPDVATALRQYVESYKDAPEAAEPAVEPAGETSKAPDQATHKDPGRPAEPVTQPVIAQAIQKSARNTAFDPAEAKAWILGEIDKAIAVAPTADRIFDGVKITDKPATYVGVKTWSVYGPKDADGLTPSLNIKQAAGGGFAVVWGKSPDQAVRAPNLELAKEYAARIIKTGKKSKGGGWQFDAAVLDAREFVSFDVPGDGRFKVVNTVEKLREFRAKVEKSPGFAKNPDRPSRFGGQGLAGAQSLDQQVADAKKFGGDPLADIGNAIEIARLKDGKDEDRLLDRFKEASGGKDYDTWRAEQEAAEEIAAREAEAREQADQGDPQAFAEMMAMYDQPSEQAQQPESSKFKSSIAGVRQAYGDASAFLRGRIYSVGVDNQHKARLEARLVGAGLTKREASDVIASAQTLKAQETRGAGPMTFLQLKYVLRAASNRELIEPVDTDGRPVEVQQPEQPAKRYAGPADASSRDGQMELANRAGTIAALKAMNAQLRAVAPDEAWADANIEEAADLDALRNQISEALVRANRASEAEQSSPLRKRLEEASGAELRAVFDALGLAGGARMTQLERVEALMREDAQAVSDALDDVQSDGESAAADTPAEAPAANQPALTGPRRNPAQVSAFTPYLAGDIVTIDGQDWQVQQDMGGWYLTSTGNWRGMHPTIQKIRGMNELIAEVERAATAQPEAAEQADAPADAEAEAPADDLLTPDQARALMTWDDLGQRDNVKRMRLSFFENAEDMAAKRGAMNYGTIESYQGGKWNIDGTTYPTLKAAKAAAVEAALVRLANDGYVAPPFAAYDAVARTYGYEVRADGAIGSEGKFPGPTIKEKGGRLRVESSKGDLLGSYPATPESLGKFLESFWGAEKQAAQPVAEQPAPVNTAAEETDEAAELWNALPEQERYNLIRGQFNRDAGAAVRNKGWGTLTDAERNQARTAIDRQGLLVRALTAGVVSPDEYPTAEVAKSFNHVSNSPETGAYVMRNAFLEAVQREYEEAAPLAETAEQKAALDDAIAEFKDEYLQRDKGVASVRGGAYSGMVAGRDNLNTNQVERRGNALDRASGDFANWLDSARGKAKAAVLAARNDQQRAAEQQAKDDKAAKRAESEHALIASLINFKKGDDVQFGRYPVAKVSFGKDGYPTSVTIEATDLTDNKFDLARTLFRGDKAKLRAIVDEVRAQQAKDAGQTETQAKADDSLAAQHEALMASVLEGTATPEAFKASFEQVVASAEAIKAELSKKTKAELLREGGPYLQMRYANETKGEIVDALYRQMIGEYALGESVTYGLGRNSYQDAVRRMVEATNADKLEQYVKDRAAAIEEAKVARAARAEALANPQTLNDYRSLLNTHIREGKTRHEAFLTLTPEQRIRYDELEAEATRETREARKRAAQTDVRAAGQTTGGQIIATKHTRDGYDLFVVQLSDRLSADDYRTVLAGAKRLGGWYSKFRGGGAVPGFQFKRREDAEAFLKLAGGDVTAAKDQVAQRRDAFADDKSQSAVERLTEMADRMEQDADAEASRDRKANTARRARFASAALNAAAAQKAMARTMRNIAQAIQDGKAKFLDAVRTRTQVEALLGYVRTAKDNELRAKYPSYADQEKRKGEPATAETAGFADFPSYTAFRSDLAMLARQMLEVDGTKKLGQKLMSVADDVTDAYLEFARNNILAVSQFGRGDALAEFASREDAERAIRRSGLVGKAIVLPIKRGQNRVILSPSEAMNRKVWAGDGDKRITLSGEFGKELVEAIGRRGNKTNGLAVPWQFQNAYDRRKLLSRIGIETPSEFRSALREVIALQETAVANKVREMELAMVGRRADGLDFFPTPAEIADQMVEAADIKPEMAVLEPSAGMGHIADRIREAGAEPDVVEISAERRELLEEKGYHLAPVNDFMNMEPRKFFTYGDIFRAPDGAQGVMVGVGRMGSQRVRLEDEQGNRLGLYNRDEVVGVAHRGSLSGYDRIIMNPPFSDRRDAEHVQHAYTLLRPGGRIVAIMGEGVFFGQDKRAQDFRDWLDSVGGTSEKLPEGSFMDPSLPVQTGVNARMVVIDKPAMDDGIRGKTDGPAVLRAASVVPPTNNEGRGVGFSRVDADRFIEDFLAATPNAPEIVAVNTFDQLPAFVQQEARNQGETEKTVKGVLVQQDGVTRVYVVVGNHASLTDFEATVFHEVAGHFGMREMLGPDFTQKLNQIYLGVGGQGGLVKIMNARGLGKQVQNYIRAIQQAKRTDAENARKAAAMGRKYRIRWTDAVAKAVLTEEVYAHIAEQLKDRPGLLDKFKALIGALRQWLRDHTFMRLANLGETDLLYMLSKARKELQGPSGGPKGGRRTKILVSERETLDRDGERLDRADPDLASAMMLARGLGLQERDGVAVFAEQSDRDAAPGGPESQSVVFRVGDSANERTGGMYHRFTRGAADTGAGYMMFADTADKVEHYGPNHYTFNPEDLPSGSVVDARDEGFRSAVAMALENNPHKLDEYQATANQLADRLDPKDIVNSAEFWDAPDLVEIVWNEVMEPNGWLAVVTNDGAIVFDSDAVKRADDTGDIPSVFRVGDSAAIPRDERRDYLAGAASRNDGPLRQFFADLFAAFKSPSSKVFGPLHKSISTQLHKAWVNKDYGEVFYLADRYERDISRFSAEPSALAPKLLPTFDKIGDAFDRMLKGDKVARMSDKVANAIFEGTLAGATPTEGRVWTNQELRDRFELDDAQIELYREARKTTDLSLDISAAGLAWQMVKKYIGDLKEAVRTAPADAAKTIELSMRELEDQLREEVQMVDGMIADAENEGEAAKLAANRSKLMRKAQEVAEARIAAEGVFKRAEDLKAGGYFPLMRFGKYNVDVTIQNEDGETERLGFYKFETEAEAKMAEQRLRREFPEANIERSISSEEAWKVYQGVDPETVALFAEHIGSLEGLDVKDDVLQAWYREAVNNRSAFKRMIHRKGTEGFDRDLTRVLASFVTSNARLAARQFNMPDIDRKIADLKQRKAPGDVVDEAERLRGYIENPEEPFQSLKGWMFVWFLGGSISSALLNATQPFMVTLPYLSQFGATQAAAELTKAMKGGASGKVTDDDLQEALLRAAEDGKVDPQQVHHLFHEGMRPFISKLPFGQNMRARAQGLMTAWGYLFGWVENFNRRTTFIAAYRMAKANPKLGDAYEFAVRAVDETQGIYGKSNRANWARGVGPFGGLGVAAFVFKQYSIAYVELLIRMAKSGPAGKRAALMQLGILVMLAGLQGLPGADDLEDLIDTAAQRMGYTGNSRLELHRYLKRVLGEEFGNIIQYGLLSAPMLRGDMSSRVGLGDLFPATAIFKPSQQNRASQIAELFGPPASMGEAVMKALEASDAGGGALGILKALTPVAVSNAWKGVDMAVTGRYNDTRGRKVVEVDMLDAVLKGVGIQPSKINAEQRPARLIQLSAQRVRQVKSNIHNLRAQAIVEKNADKRRRADEMLRDWNAKNPDARLSINSAAILRRVKEMNAERRARLMKTLPKELRQSASEEYAQ